jgi:N-dimethylarginine dimethylaminohydrolase
VTEDALAFAANAVCVDRTIVLSSCSSTLRSKLQERGYLVVESPLHAFLRSGGAASCLTLRLDHGSNAKAAVATAAVDRRDQD